MRRNNVFFGLVLMAIIGWIIHSGGQAIGSESRLQSGMLVGICEAPQSGEQSISATLQDHKMALYPPPSCPTAPTEKTTFDPGDQVMNWNYITGITAGSTYQFDWYAPNGTNYRSSGSYSSSANYCTYCYWEDGIPDQPGSWYVEFRLNGTLLYTDYFTVTGGAPPVWPMLYSMLFREDKGSLSLLRTYRDQVLASTPLGNTYLKRLYARSHEVLLLLLSNPDLLNQANALLPLLLPEIEQATAGGAGYLSADTVGGINAFLAALGEGASPELLDLINNVKADIKNPQTIALFGFEIE